jgi:murein L,D-transpeptidase YafK
MNISILRAGMLVAALALAGCTDASFEDVAPRSEKRIPDELLKDMAAKGMNRSSSILGRIFKEEGKLEVWKMRTNGRYALIKVYNICKWSGQLGPKFIEGDRQAPEGFYTVRPAQMNPNSGFHLSFNIGYPNAFDRAHGRTGANLMVHGACSSAGCYSMENDQIEEIYALARDAFRGGQMEFQIQAFPFRMTAANMARYKNDPNYPFWQNLKEGYDQFEITKLPPKVDVCEKRYVFNRIAADGATFNPAGACPPSSTSAELLSAYQTYKAAEDEAMSKIPATTAALPVSQSIGGIEEAKLVQEWTRKRARGERVPVEPPAMRSDGSVAVTSLMGRIDSPAGRKMAQIEAAAAAKKAAEEAKKRAAEEKRLAAELAKAEKAAAEKAAEVAAKSETSKAKTDAGATAEAAAAAPAEEKGGLLGGVRKRIGNLFGS